VPFSWYLSSSLRGRSGRIVSRHHSRNAIDNPGVLCPHHLKGVMVDYFRRVVSVSLFFLHQTWPLHPERRKWESDFKAPQPSQLRQRDRHRSNRILRVIISGAESRLAAGLPGELAAVRVYRRASMAGITDVLPHLSVKITVPLFQGVKKNYTGPLKKSRTGQASCSVPFSLPFLCLFYAVLRTGSRSQ